MLCISYNADQSGRLMLETSMCDLTWRGEMDLDIFSLRFWVVTWNNIGFTISFFLFFRFIYLFERESACACLRGREGQWERISSIAPIEWGRGAPSHNPEIMTWPEMKSRGLTDWTTQAPQGLSFLKGVKKSWHSSFSSPTTASE